MNGRRSRALLKAVTPMLEPGEQIVAMSLVNLSEISVKRNLAMGVAAAVLSGGTMIAAAAPTPIYLAISRERLFLFVANPAFAKPDRHLATFPLRGLTRTEVKNRVLKKSFDLVDASSGSALRLFFPALVRNNSLDIVAGLVPVAEATV
ncbi:hypothetical protein OHS17_13165 [Streptomyces sp. NBC_00523]|uniref:hypothetical protein n=1 Tax=unclassified Streptomyces TaxID=2593676 RepID=UPI002E809DFB|nr:hypothetical protein [Streptomyces sp. NBC_00523]WUD00532.1 hypothetical protein OHS17_13165 [Streptomyces sp. NBC_00523]